MSTFVDFERKKEPQKYFEKRESTEHTYVAIYFRLVPSTGDMGRDLC